MSPDNQEQYQSKEGGKGNIQVKVPEIGKRGKHSKSNLL